MLVEQDQEVRRTAFLGVRRPLPSDPLAEPRPIVVRAGESVHGDAASPPRPSLRALDATEIPIGRASIELVSLADVVGQDGFSWIVEHAEIRVDGCGSPIQPGVVDPGVGTRHLV